MRYSTGMRGAGYSIVQRSASNANNENTSPNVTTPTQTPRTKVALASKESNALKQSFQTPTKRGINMPPPEKHNNRPLFISAPKAPPRPPLTPRIAGSTSTTATLRKAPRSEINGTSSPIQKDECTPPGVTPRSNSRRTRRDSPNSTPSSTSAPGASAPRLSDRGFRTEDNIRPTVTFAPASKDQRNAHSNFFYASDTKAAAPGLPQRPSLHTTGSSFLYANGDSIPPVTGSGNSAVGSAVGSNIGDDRFSPMFFHANGPPDVPPRSHSPSSTLSSSRSRVSTRGITRKSLRQPPASSPIPTRPNIATARGKSTQSVVSSRRVSFEPNTRGRPLTTTTIELTPPASKVSESPEESPPPSPSSFSGVVTVSNPGGEGDERVEDRGVAEHGLGSPLMVGSPVRVGGTLEQMNELAAEARRNRKVLDLEITNSSLEAINRTLERQMRKQTAELRRYRRLSRSGRLSLADSVPGRNRSGIDGADLSDTSEDDAKDIKDEEEEEEHTSEEGSVDDGTMSPRAIAESDARHRTRDEKRFRVELSKHQQMITDSMAMNSSLKRCLAWTEALISEGQKALAYSVRPSDVNIGGRVLISEDIEIDESEGLSEIGAKLLREARSKRQASLSPSAGSFDGNSNTDAWIARNDRDSGIELPSNYHPDPSEYDESSFP